MKKITTKKIKILAVLVALGCTAAQTMYAQDSRTSCKWDDLYEKWVCDTKAIKPAEEKDPLGTKTIQSIDAGYYRKLLPKENSGYSQSRASQIEMEIQKIEARQFQLLQQERQQQIQIQPSPATNTTQAPSSLPQRKGYAGYYVWQNPLNQNKMLLSREWESSTVSSESNCVVAETFDCFYFTMYTTTPNQTPVILLTVKVAHTNNSAIDAETYANEYSKQIALKYSIIGLPLHSRSKYVNGVKVYEQQLSNQDVATLKYDNSIWQVSCTTIVGPNKIDLSGPHQEICNRLAGDILETAFPQPQ